MAAAPTAVYESGTSQFRQEVANFRRYETVRWMYG